MLGSTPGTPTRGRGDRGTHLRRAPRWLKALPFVHGLGVVLAFVLLHSTDGLLPSTIPLALATFFLSVGTLMGWYGQFTQDAPS